MVSGDSLAPSLAVTVAREDGVSLSPGDTCYPEVSTWQQGVRMQHTIEHRPPERPSIEERAADPATLDATLVLKLGYRGSGFCGFAAQPGRRTVAGEVTRSLETLLRREVDLTCAAARTPACTHRPVRERSVTASELAMPARRLMHGLSALLPDDISPAALYRAPKGFSARFDARSRSYRYRIVAGEARPVLAWDHAWWLRGELDAAAMHDARPAARGRA